MNDFDILSENISNQLNMLFKQIYSKGYQDGRADAEYTNNGNPDV